MGPEGRDPKVGIRADRYKWREHGARPWAPINGRKSMGFTGVMGHPYKWSCFHRTYNWIRGPPCMASSVFVLGHCKRKSKMEQPQKSCVGGDVFLFQTALQGVSWLTSK